MNAYDFMSGSPFLTFCIVYMLTTTLVRIVKSLVRARNIRFAGWPPLHLDADGDFKPEPEKDDEK